MPMTRLQQYKGATMARKSLETFMVVGLPHFAEYSMEGDEEFIERVGRLKKSLQQYFELENRTRTVIERQSRVMAKNAEKAIPEGKGQLTAEDCKVAFLRFLFLADLMAMHAVFGCPQFAYGRDWTFCQEWIRGAVKLFESKAGDEPLPEETWADEAYAKLCNALKR